MADFAKAGEWLAFAEMDLNSAKYLLGMRPVPTEIICYHCQQSAEKCLKGLLVLNEIQYPKIHDLVELCRLCEPFVSDNNILRVTCLPLNVYGIQPRYPIHVEITEQQMKAALANAKTLLELLRPLFKENEPDAER
jgi:HEPN domain-containing protein